MRLVEESLSLHRQSQDIPIKKTSGNTAEEGISPRPCGVTVICMLRDWRL